MTFVKITSYPIKQLGQSVEIDFLKMGVQGKQEIT